MWLFHNWRPVPRNQAHIIKSSLVNYHLYPSSKHIRQGILEEIEPIALEESMATPLYHAIHVIGSGGAVVPPFVARTLMRVKPGTDMG